MGDWGSATAKVIGIKHDRFIEFEFALEPELAVELVMPVAEFHRFCREHDVTILPGEEEVALRYLTLSGQHHANPPITGDQPQPREGAR